MNKNLEALGIIRSIPPSFPALWWVNGWGVWPINICQSTHRNRDCERQHRFIIAGVYTDLFSSSKAYRSFFSSRSRPNSSPGCYIAYTMSLRSEKHIAHMAVAIEGGGKVCRERNWESILILGFHSCTPQFPAAFCSISKQCVSILLKFHLGKTLQKH